MKDVDIIEEIIRDLLYEQVINSILLTPEERNRRRAIPQLVMLIAPLARCAIREHYSRGDPYYSCPKHPKGSANDEAGSRCDCGADEHNVKVKVLLEDMQKVLTKTGGNT